VLLFWGCLDHQEQLLCFVPLSFEYLNKEAAAAAVAGKIGARVNTSSHQNLMGNTCADA